MRRLAALAVPMMILAACSGGDDATSSTPIEVFEVVEDVAYYYACGDEVLVLPDGRQFFPIIEQERIDPSRYVQDVPAALASVQRAALTLAVAPPRPGDDIGTLVVYEDGIARFRSRLGTTAWLDQNARTYPWVC